jgi:hypothetical protein
MRSAVAAAAAATRCLLASRGALRRIEPSVGLSASFLSPLSSAGNVENDVRGGRMQQQRPLWLHVDRMMDADNMALSKGGGSLMQHNANQRSSSSGYVPAEALMILRKQQVKGTYCISPHCGLRFFLLVELCIQTPDPQLLRQFSLLLIVDASSERPQFFVCDKQQMMVYRSFATGSSASSSSSSSVIFQLFL